MDQDTEIVVFVLCYMTHQADSCCVQDLKNDAFLDNFFIPYIIKSRMDMITFIWIPNHQVLENGDDNFAIPDHQVFWGGDHTTRFIKKIQLIVLEQAKLF
jgi:hypothetical protein